MGRNEQSKAQMCPITEDSDNHRSLLHAEGRRLPMCPMINQASHRMSCKVRPKSRRDHIPSTEIRNEVTKALGLATAVPFTVALGATVEVEALAYDCARTSEPIAEYRNKDSNMTTREDQGD